MSDEQNVTEEIWAQVVGASLLGVVRLLVDSGMSSTGSMHLATFFLIEETLGREPVRALGLPRQTAARWRREIAAAAQTERAQEFVNDPAYELEALNGLLPLIGLRDLRMVRIGGNDV